MQMYETTQHMMTRDVCLSSRQPNPGRALEQRFAYGREVIAAGDVYSKSSG